MVGYRSLRGGWEQEIGWWVLEIQAAELGGPSLGRATYVRSWAEGCIHGDTWTLDLVLGCPPSLDPKHGIEEMS